jgi:hypothetical protein
MFVFKLKLVDPAFKVREVEAKAHALGALYAIPLTKTGPGQFEGSLSLEAPPRLSRLQIDCSTKTGAHPCFDAVHFFDDTHADALSLTIRHGAEGPVAFVAGDGAGLSTAMHFGWGFSLLTLIMFVSRKRP